MFILLFIVLRHQYLCSAVRTVCSYTSDAWSTASNIRMEERLALCVCHKGWRFDIVCERKAMTLLEVAFFMYVAVYISYHRSMYGLMIIPEIAGSVPAPPHWPWKLTVLIPTRNIRNHNPPFSRSIIHNVITGGLTGHSSCSFTVCGFYQVLISQWLPILCRAYGISSLFADTV